MPYDLPISYYPTPTSPSATRRAQAEHEAAIAAIAAAISRITGATPAQADAAARAAYRRLMQEEPTR